MNDNCKRIIGFIAKILRSIFKAIFVIFVIYYGFLVLFDLTIRPIFNNKSPRLFQEICYAFDQRAKTDEGNPVKMAAEAVLVSIQDITNTHRENAIEFEKTYDGKILRLTGTVSRIKNYSHSDGVDNYCVVLSHDTEKYSFDDIDVYPRKEEINKLDGLVIGQTVTIVGKCEDEGNWGINVQIINAFFE